MRNIIKTGGANFGYSHFKWPLVKLIATANEITLHVRFGRRYHFRPQDLITIKVVNEEGKKGLQFVHRLAELEQDVYFWPFGNPKKLLDEIYDIGFYIEEGYDDFV